VASGLDFGGALVGVLLTFSVTPAAGQCIQFSSPVEAFQVADVVFVGTVTALERTGQRGSHISSDLVTFRAERYWKGRVTRDMRVAYDRPLSIGQKYLVFASVYDRASQLWSSDEPCRWTERLENASAKLAWLAANATSQPGGIDGVPPTADRFAPDQEAVRDTAVFVKQALERVLARGDLPDGNLLGSATRIAVREEMPVARLEVAPTMLPQRDGYTFYLLSEAAAQAEADRIGRAVYIIALDLPRVSGSHGSVRIGVDIRLPRRGGGKPLCCCSAVAHFERQGDRWELLLWTDRLCG
jgi:hypothetical protein